MRFVRTAERSLPFQGFGKTVFLWRDQEHGMEFRVEIDRGIAGTGSHLVVKRYNQEKRVLLDSHMPVSIVGLVRYEDWLLVLNNSFVLGGFNYGSGVLIGRGDWSNLPFTVRTIRGAVVAERAVSPGISVALPAGFPIIHEPPMETRTTAHSDGSSTPTKTRDGWRRSPATTTPRPGT